MNTYTILGIMAALAVLAAVLLYHAFLRRSAFILGHPYREQVVTECTKILRDDSAGDRLKYMAATLIINYDSDSFKNLVAHCANNNIDLSAHDATRWDGVSVDQRATLERAMRAFAMLVLLQQNKWVHILRRQEVQGQQLKKAKKEEASTVSQLLEVKLADDFELAAAA